MSISMACVLAWLRRSVSRETGIRNSGLLLLLVLEEEKGAGIAPPLLVLIPGHLLLIGVGHLAEKQAGALLGLLVLVPVTEKGIGKEVEMVGRKAQGYAINTQRRANVPTGTDASTSTSRLLGL